MESTTPRGGVKETYWSPISRAGKYLTVTVNDECNGFGHLHVQELIGVTAATLPQNRPVSVASSTSTEKRISVIELPRRFDMETGAVHTGFIHRVERIANKIAMRLEVDSVLSFEDESIQYHRVETK